MTLFVPLLFVCSATMTNQGHCEVIRIPEVTMTVEACATKLRKEAERLEQMVPRPFPHLPGDWLLRGECAAEVLHETLVMVD